jgi:ribonuclease VapC
MPAKVLDSWALLAFFKGEPAAAKVERLIEAATKSGEPLLLSAINWAEIYYTMERAGGRIVAEEVAGEIASLPIEVAGLGDDLELARQAARFKAAHKLSLADAFAAALAKARKAELVTGDPEFKTLEREVKIVWLK